MQVLENAGFINVDAQDRTSHFINVLKSEIKKTEAIKDEFIKVTTLISIIKEKYTDSNYYTRKNKIYKIIF